MAGNFLSNLISDVGHAFNAPVLFNWDTNAARNDAQTGALAWDGSAKRSLSSVAANSDPILRNQQQQDAYWSGVNTRIPQYDSGPISESTIWGTGGGTGGVGGTGGTGWMADPSVLAQYDQGINTLNTGLGRLDSQLGIARSNIDTQFNTNKNELESTFNQAKNSYNTSTTQNSQNLRSNKNTINDQASNGLRGLLRMLGAYGAGGSSDSLNASKAVADQASMQRAGAGQTFAQNQSNLDTNWGNFQTEDGNNRRKLDDWRTQQINSAQAQSDTTRQSLLQQLADLQGKRAAYKGGSYTGAAQPLIDQANGLNGKIDELGRLNPTYTGQKAVYNAPTLESYLTGSGTAAKVDPSSLMSGDSPLATILAQQKEKKLGQV